MNEKKREAAKMWFYKKNGVSQQCGSLQENRPHSLQNAHAQNQKESAGIPWTHKGKRWIGKLNPSEFEKAPITLEH